MSKRVFKCRCGADVTVTSEVIKAGDGVATLFEGKCSTCGNEGSGHYPEQVRRQLLDEET